MQSLLLIKVDYGSFEPSDLEQVFRSDSYFKNMRFDTPGGDPIACKYVESDAFALINLSEDRECVSLSNTGRAALKAVLIIQRSLGIPLRLFDSSYTFDLTFSDFSTVEELEAAIDNARTS